jgi:RNA polymerase sigma-70 factor (ECF subfamily)
MGHAGGMTGEARQAAERLARDRYGRLLSVLAASSRDIAAAEDALADALAAALSDWPASGVPRSPEAWLLAVARRRLIDGARRRQSADAALEQLAWLTQGPAESTDAGFPDARLKLLFVCAHPAIAPEIRAPLMLQVVLGFSAEEIAPLFLVAPATLSQRLVRAKRKLREAGAAFRVPEENELPERLDAVLDAIYALFTQGWSLPFEDRERRAALASDALWLARLTAALTGERPEAMGLLALILHAWARDAARRDAQGRYVPLSEQDPALWDHALIDEAETIIRRAAAHATAGRFQFEAAIQSAHAERRLTGVTDWPAVLRLHDGLAAISRSPAAAVNRCVAMAEVHGAEVARLELEALQADSRLTAYQPYWAALAEVRRRTGDGAGAVQAFDRAIALQADPAARDFLIARRARMLSRDDVS